MQTAELPIPADSTTVAPAYPMKPWPYMPDYFKIPSQPSSNSLGVAVNVPIQDGVWYLEPMYTHASHDFVFNCSSRIALDCNLKPIELPSGIVIGLHQTCCTKLENADVWLHCQGLTGFDEVDHGASATVIVDIMDFEKTYLERREFLESKFTQLGIKLTPGDKYAFLAPRYSELIRHNLWYALHEVNRTTKDLYSGMIAKKADSMYERNTTNPQHTTFWWMEHKFAA
jgi:hypothetical protein